MKIMDKSPKFVWGMIAFGIYFILLGLLVFYFNSKNVDKAKKYVKKNENRIQVGLAISKEKKVSTVKPKKEKVQKKKPKEKLKSKITSKVKDTQKKVIKEKIVKKIIKNKDIKTQKVKNKNIKKPKKTLDLFSNVKIDENKLDMNITDKPIKTKPDKSLIKVTEKKLSASERVSSSLKIQKEFKSGEENAYFAKVQRMLEDWPAQSDFAGERATVILLINQNGKFKFRVKSGSNINEFNEGLIAFLEQLQDIGFGPHNGERTYEYEAEFIAKE